jgi:hypothetical protein
MLPVPSPSCTSPAINTTPIRYFDQAFWSSDYINLAVNAIVLLSAFLLSLLVLPGLFLSESTTSPPTPAMPDPAQINRSLGTIKTELEYLANSGVLSPPQLQSIQAQLPVSFSFNLFLYPSPLFRLCREMVIQVRVNKNR